MLLIGDSLISSINRYQDVWSEYFSKHNTLNFVLPEDKTQNLLWRIKKLKFPSNSTLSCIFIYCIFILCGRNNMDHNSPEEIVSGLSTSGISVQTQFHLTKAVIIPLLPFDKKLSLRRRNINIINSLLESECSKYNLYTYNHELEWLNADGSWSKSLFCSDKLHLVKEWNELLWKEIVAFYKSLEYHSYLTKRSYKSVPLLYLKNSEFQTLETCYSDYASSKVKLNWNVSFQKSSSIAFVDNCKYVSTYKSYMLPSHNTPSLKKSVISPSISHVSTFSKFVHSAMSGQNIQCTNAPSKSVSCSTVV